MSNELALDLAPTSTPSRPAATKSIGPHRKTRTGCLECKRRRVKCDERHPQCRRCAVGGRNCVFAVRSSPSDHDNRHVAHVLPFTNTSSDPTTAIPPLSGVSHDDDGQSPSAPALPDAFSVLHMRLLYHAITQMASYMALETDVRPIIDYALHSTHSTPYVLRQVLALSALHCSVQQPEMAAELQYHATDLQNRALSAFNAAKNSSSESGPVPPFIFASLLGIHVLRDCLAQEQCSVGAFVTNFVRYSRIHRGVRSVISGHWDEISESHLKPLLYT